MNEFDELLQQEQGQSESRSDQRFDKEAWKQQKQAQRETVYAMIDEAAQSVAQDGSTFRKYLDVQSRFGRYSVSNALLVLAQKPEATSLKDFETWKEQGAYIHKKETGIYILEPGDEYEREDGTKGVSYRPKKVFDVSQVGDAKRPGVPAYSDDRVRLKALMEHTPVNIKISENLPEGVNAMYQPEKREIHVCRGMSFENAFRALSQELAHAEMDKGNGSYNRAEHGFDAYCVSYVLCKQYGVQTEDFDFKKAPEMFAGMDAQQVRAELSVIKEAAGEISGRMNRVLAQQREQQRKDEAR